MYREKKTELPRMRLATARLRMLPRFLIVSVERGGTTSLYRYLTQHPCVGESFRKEVDFFDFNWSRGLGWYRAHFPTRAQAAWTRLRHGSPLVAGEATPYYLYHPQVPARVARTLPDVRLVALVRNPVDRAWSHYNMNRRQQKETLSFEEAIEREEERLAGEEERLASGEIAFSESHYKFGYKLRGRYAERIERWYEHVPRERLLVVPSEELYAEPQAVVDRVLAFLEMAPFRLHSVKAYNQKPYDEIDPATRRRLSEYFAPHNARLCELLGRDPGWDLPPRG